MKDFKVGVQLWSVRDAMQKDIDGTLKALKEMGYDYVEFAGYYDFSAEELKQKLDTYGLKAISTHQRYQDILENPEKWVKFIKTLGLKFFAVPGVWEEGHKGSEKFEQTVEDFKKIGKILKDNGIQFLYHNHQHEFNRVDGKFQLEWLLDEVGEDLMPEIDVCWVHYAGYKPDDYIMKYENRLPVLHMKDFTCTKLGNKPVYTDIVSDAPKYPDMEAVGFEFRPVGGGVQDVPAILKACEKVGTEYIIVEDESYDPNVDMMECVKKSREYLKSLGI